MIQCVPAFKIPNRTYIGNITELIGSVSFVSSELFKKGVKQISKSQLNVTGHYFCRI
jgi:hypothetical protein